MDRSNRRPLLYVGLHATDDPTLATLPFLVATGAAAAEIDCAIALLGEAAHLAKPGMVDAIKGVGFPPLAELVAKVKEAGIPVYVWGSCAVARGVTQEDLARLGASFTDPVGFSQLAAERSVVTF